MMHLRNAVFLRVVKVMKKARYQLAYEELFIMQSGLALLRNKEQCHVGPKMEPDGVLMAQCRSNLPLKLTG